MLSAQGKACSTAPGAGAGAGRGFAGPRVMRARELAPVERCALNLIPPVPQLPAK